MGIGCGSKAGVRLTAQVSGAEVLSLDCAPGVVSVSTLYRTAERESGRLSGDDGEGERTEVDDARLELVLGEALLGGGQTRNRGPDRAGEPVCGAAWLCGVVGARSGWRVGEMTRNSHSTGQRTQGRLYGLSGLTEHSFRYSLGRHGAVMW